MRFGIVVFPGTWSDHDCQNALSDVLRQPTTFIWHQERDLADVDCVILPGGFSYGDYLRAGAIARFSPVMDAVAAFAERGGLVLGICNGFQILCEAGLLPGVLIRNQDLQFHCEMVHLRVERADTAFTNAARPGQILRVPISHGEGNYFADPDTLRRIEANGQVLVRYCAPDGTVTPEANLNGSLNNIAGVMNERGNVFGLMPHPERACEPLLGSADGAVIFQSIMQSRIGAQ
ncbi:MAG: phosphoribosylformylglycinamidine synthase subunit PurQ [Dehalococcoidia bacterium]|nr:phosphoribosylformylglycinamidine synthase subunit PurQ [Dehalococcoidia bacterium]